MQIPLTKETCAIARRIIWFEKPQIALADPIRFMAYALTYALPSDLTQLKKYLTKNDIQTILDNAPAGIIDARSWAYWNIMADRYPVPSMKERMPNNVHH